MSSLISKYHMGDLAHHYQKTLTQFDSDETIFRLWAKDASLFAPSSEILLDWISASHDIAEQLPRWAAISQRIQQKGFSAVVLLGMGGSSLAPLVFKTILAEQDVPFFVLDTIHPEAVMRLTSSIDVKNTLFIVASKSGTTLESNLLYRHFLQVLADLGVPDSYGNFMAITDPTTPLEQESVECGFLQGPFGMPGIGGRFSAFSAFGIMPALLMGIDVERLRASLEHMVENSGPSIAAKDNEAALLGAFLAVSALNKKDRLMIHLSSSLSSLGLWLEQLIAESLGKQGLGLVPIIVDDHAQSFKNTSAIFIQLDGDDELSYHQNHATPSVYISLADKHDIGGLMYQFKIAVALAGTAMGINPFDQPNVEKSKKHTKAMIDNLINTHQPASLPPSCLGQTRAEDLNNFLSSVNDDDYIAILSYLDDNEHNANIIRTIAHNISKKTSVPVIRQIGPRYLHSTGQLFKGGQNHGHFIFITGSYACDVRNDQNLKFSDIHVSQAHGDAHALKENGRRVHHIHVHNIEQDLKELCLFSDLS